MQDSNDDSKDDFFYSRQAGICESLPASGMPILNYIDLPREFVQGQSRPFVITAKGQSMEPLIADKDRLLIEWIDRPRDNDIVLAVINESLVIRQITIEARCVRLKAINPVFGGSNTISRADDLEILGRVKALYREI